MLWNKELEAFSRMAWDFWELYGMLILNKTFVILLIIGATWAALKLRKILISRIFLITRLDVKQRNTLESLLLSFTKYVFVIISLMMVLSNMGVEVGPIIAGAGVIGLAVGFGAQTLVKDLITGFFIIFEDQFSVGDFVTINNGEINGTVVSVGLRATKIRTWAQHVVVIQNSEIRISQNYNREKMRAIVHVSVPYETDPADVEIAVHAMSRRMVAQLDYLFLLDDKNEPIEPPQLYGITDVENNALGAKYTVVALVKDVHYFTACKLIRQFMVEELKAVGVHISYPRRVERKDTEFVYHA